MLFNRRSRPRTSRPVKHVTLPARWNAARLRLEALDERVVPAFLDAVNYAAGTGPQAVVAGYFNNDAVLDLAVAGSDTVNVLLGNADGTFQPAVSSPAGNTPTSLAAGDFNADGMLDLAAADAGYGASDVTVLLGNGNGSFQTPASIDLGYYSYGAESVAVGDFNADGNLDLGVLSNYYVPGYWGYYGSYPGYYYGLAHVLVGTGTGTFSGPTTSWLGYDYHTSAAVADFNGDLKLDFAAITDYGSVDVALGDGTGAFGSPATFYAGYGSGSSLIASDLSNDGKVDLAATVYSADAVSVLLGDGLGSFGSTQSYTAGSRPGSLDAADFNDDGTTDLVTTNSDSATVSVLLGTGSGAFKPPVTAAAGSSPSGVAVGDFNDDGLTDAASANFTANSVSVLLNDSVWPALDAPSITVNDVTVTEGNTGTADATFTVSLSAASGQTVTVHYATVDGTATADGGDYQVTSGTLTFAPGDTTMTVTVPVNGDRLGESSESFLLVLTDPTNAFLADAKGVGNITDDEPHVTIDYGPVIVTEGNTGTTAAVFTVRLSNAYDAPVDVNFSTAEGDTEWWLWGWYEPPPAATSGTDFQSQSDTLTFAPGDTVKTIAVAVNGDRIVESDEYFSVNLTGSPNAAIDAWASHAVGVIVDDEPLVSIDSASVKEGNTGTATMTFKVSLSTASDAPVTVDYATSDYYYSSATAGVDYQATTGTLTFAAGDTTMTVTVPVNGDRLGEYDETFVVNLDGADGARIASGTGYGTILDDEPRISINSQSVTEGNHGTKVMTFTVTLSAAYDEAVTVRYSTEDGSAKAGEDYVATSGTLTFATGETSKTFTVVIKGDKKKEYDESFSVQLSDASSNALLWQSYGYGDIFNDDGGRGHRR
ncbi:MAG TPA: Calx-beta domain-containing protein [Fimbriiglobus sp.]|nr:Calx-beta domain-containing protein [Fimbriiglobus sp.]